METGGHNDLDLEQAEQERLLRRRITQLLTSCRSKRQKRSEMWDLLQELRRQRQAASTARSDQLWEEQKQLWRDLCFINQELPLLLKQLILRQQQLMDLRRAQIGSRKPMDSRMSMDSLKLRSSENPETKD